MLCRTEQVVCYKYSNFLEKMKHLTVKGNMSRKYATSEGVLKYTWFIQNSLVSIIIFQKFQVI